MTGKVLTACFLKCGYFPNGCRYIPGATGVTPAWFTCRWLIAYAQQIKAPENELILSLREEIYCEDFAAINWPKQRNTVCEKDCYTTPSPVLKWMNFFTNSYEKFKWPWLRKKTTDYILKYLNAEDEQTNYHQYRPGQ